MLQSLIALVAGNPDVIAKGAAGAVFYLGLNLFHYKGGTEKLGGIATKVGTVVGVIVTDLIKLVSFAPFPGGKASLPFTMPKPTERIQQTSPTP